MLLREERAEAQVMRGELKPPMRVGAAALVAAAACRMEPRKFERRVSHESVVVAAQAPGHVKGARERGPL